MIDISEVVKSTKRYFRYVWDWKEEEIEHIDIKFLVNDETGNIGEIISQNILSLPLMIVVGKEHDFRLKEIYEDSDEYLKKITEWKFLYKLFPERIGYVSAPFKPELMWIPKQDYEYKLNLENIKSIFDTISRLTRKIKKNLLLNENLKDPYYFIKIAGRYFTTEDMAEKYSIERLSTALRPPKLLFTLLSSRISIDLYSSLYIKYYVNLNSNIYAIKKKYYF